MEKKFTNMRDITSSFANAMNLLRPETAKLHQRVAYLAYNIADEMDYGEPDKKENLAGTVKAQIKGTEVKELQKNERHHK